MRLPLEPSSEFIHVLVADSNQTQSQLMCGALRRQPGLRVSCCRAELSACLSSLEAVQADIVLLANSTSDYDHQYEILRGLRAAYPGVRLILLVDTYDRDLVVNALRYGASGIFWSAVRPFKALCRCIYAVHQGQIWVNSEQMRYLLDALANAPVMHVINAKGEGVLTAREDQVVSLVAEGVSNREIAEQLSIKENTVKKSLLHIYDKLGVSNRVELGLYALTHRDKYRSQSVASKRPPARADFHSATSETDSLVGSVCEGGATN
jgi:two-component system, NarL family, nitrate/nitrite response regulator NarL